MRKPKILCICCMGENRSKYLASYLKNKGYKTRFGGIGFGLTEKIAHNPFNQEDINWAEIIILIRKRYLPLLKKYYKIRGKRVIILDVTDSKEIIGQKYPEFNNLDFKSFQRKWTHPQLRKAIRDYLPLAKN